MERTWNETGDRIKNSTLLLKTKVVDVRKKADSLKWNCATSVVYLKSNGSKPRQCEFQARPPGRPKSGLHNGLDSCLYYIYYMSYVRKA